MVSLRVRQLGQPPERTIMAEQPAAIPPIRLAIRADRTPPGPLGSFRAASLFQSKPRPKPRRKAGVASSKRVGGIGPPDDKRRLSLAGPQVIHGLCFPGGRVGCSTHHLSVGSGDTSPRRGAVSPWLEVQSKPRPAGWGKSRGAPLNVSAWALGHGAARLSYPSRPSH